MCGDSCVADAPLAIPDGVGGVYVAWREGRDYSVTDDDAYAQRLTASGTIAPGWPAGGLPVSVAENSQGVQAIATDGGGGLLLCWVDGRNKQLGNGGDIYAQRVLSDGTIASGWPVNGAPVVRAPDSQSLPAIASDGAGGAYVVWQEWRYQLTNRVDVYAQHLTATGDVALGWPVDGLPVCANQEDQAGPFGILPDGSGGAIIVWNDGRGGVLAVYGQHLFADGTIAPGWVQDGNALVPGKFKPTIAPDEAGGFYVGCATPGYLPGSDWEYYAQRFTFAGTRSPGWPEGGALVCAAPDFRNALDVAPDGFGGLLLTWWDTRLGTTDIFAARVLPDGSRAPGWTPNGVQLSEPVDGSTMLPRIVGDGTGGAYVAWERDPVASATRSLVQHLEPDGSLAPGWPFGGIEVATGPTPQFTPQIATDGAGGAIVVWDEASLAQRRLGLYAQRFMAGGPVAVELSLASVESTPERVSLLWQGPGAGALAAEVERRAESSGWQALGPAIRDGSDRLRFEDRSVSPGERYAYRLRYLDEGVERLSSESWVDVPHALELALHGLRPNPAVREVTVSFTLPTAGPATLELLDVAGRRLIERQVGSLGTGRHLQRLDDGARIPAGLYWLRLTQGGCSLLARGAVIR
ncbi:MAG TPA: T9SS type A sorting domain-containing protein [Candidatus Eisenbacteria bacterium]